MAAIKVNANSSWKVANWVFVGVMEEVLSALPPESELFHEIQQTIASNVLYFSYLGLSTEAQNAFRDASVEGLANALSRGALGFAQPQEYPTFMEHFRDLINLLTLEP